MLELVKEYWFTKEASKACLEEVISCYNLSSADFRVTLLCSVGFRSTFLRVIQMMLYFRGEPLRLAR